MTWIELRGERVCFLSFEDASHDFGDADEAWSVYVEDSHGREFDAVYIPHENDNFYLISKYDTTEYEAQTLCMAAFCFLSVILISE